VPPRASPDAIKSLRVNSPRYKLFRPEYGVFRHADNLTQVEVR
jgi:hypothetical protein